MLIFWFRGSSAFLTSVWATVSGSISSRLFTKKNTFIYVALLRLSVYIWRERHSVCHREEHPELSTSTHCSSPVPLSPFFFHFITGPSGQLSPPQPRRFSLLASHLPNLSPSAHARAHSRLSPAPGELGGIRKYYRHLVYSWPSTGGARRKRKKAGVLNMTRLLK